MPQRQSSYHETKEIAGPPPGWLIRSGSGILFFLVLLIFTLSYFIHYPEKIICRVELISEVQPIAIKSRIAGRLKIIKHPDQAVKKGQIIAYIHDDTPIETVRKLQAFAMSINEKQLESFDDSISQAFSRLPLGEFRNNLTNLLTALKRRSHFISQQPVYQRINQLRRDLASATTVLSQHQKVAKKEADAMSNRKILFERDSLLHAKAVTSENEFRELKVAYLVAQRNFEELLKQQVMLEQSILTIENQIETLNTDHKQQILELEVVIEQQLAVLMEQIQVWERDHLLLSPMDGQLVADQILTNDQWIKSGEKLLHVIPVSSDIKGFAYLDEIGSGKVHLEQEILIQLDDFDYTEFGVLTGNLAHKSTLKTEKGYLITFTLPKGLRSSYDEYLSFSHHMTGTGTIVIRDTRLLERFFLKFKAASNNKPSK